MIYHKQANGQGGRPVTINKHAVWSQGGKRIKGLLVAALPVKRTSNKALGGILWGLPAAPDAVAILQHRHGAALADARPYTWSLAPEPTSRALGWAADVPLVVENSLSLRSLLPLYPLYVSQSRRTLRNCERTSRCAVIFCIAVTPLLSSSPT